MFKQSNFLFPVVFAAQESNLSVSNESETSEWVMQGTYVFLVYLRFVVEIFLQLLTIGVLISCVCAYW